MKEPLSLETRERPCECRSECHRRDSVAVEQHFPRDGQNVTRLREDQDWGAQDLSGKYLLAVSPRQTRGLLLPTDGDTELTSSQWVTAITLLPTIKCASTATREKC